MIAKNKSKKFSRNYPRETFSLRETLVIFLASLPHTSSQVKLLITNIAFFIEQRATAQSKTGIFRDYGVAEAPPGFQSEIRYYGYEEHDFVTGFQNDRVISTGERK
jgi:hypothetical protein